MFYDFVKWGKMCKIEFLKLKKKNFNASPPLISFILLNLVKLIKDPNNCEYSYSSVLFFLTLKNLIQLQDS